MLKTKFKRVDLDRIRSYCFKIEGALTTLNFATVLQTKTLFFELSLVEVSKIFLRRQTHDKPFRELVFGILSVNEEEFFAIIYLIQLSVHIELQ